MNAKACLSALGSLLAFAVPTQAATVVCSGTIDTLQFDATSTGSGYFSIKLGTMNVAVYFCDPTNSFSAPGGYAISPEACRALYATVLAAKVSGIPVTNMYFDGTEVPATCDGWVQWQSANIRHYLF